MLESFFQNPVSAKGLPESLVLQLKGFIKSRMEEGYADQTVRAKLQLLTKLGQWLGRNRLSITNLDEQLVGAFLKHRKRVQLGNLKTLQQFLNHLRKSGVVRDREMVPDQSPMAELLNRYEEYLRSERGLVTITIRDYKSSVRKFLVERFRKGQLLKELKLSDISDFILQHGRSMGVRRAQLMTTALRSFFRFLFQRGELATNLAASVPTVANWRLSTLPKYRSTEEVKRVLKTCNRRTATGRRDYAILLLLARLGLRAGEVIALQLDDINWRAGEILVRGKGLVHDRMPLPADVGQALASYLRRDRPACQTRQVFVRIRAPRRGFAGPSALTTIVYRAFARADLHPPFKGAHSLRHYVEFLTMSSDIGQRPAHVGKFGSKRACGEAIARHSFLDSMGY